VANLPLVSLVPAAKCATGVIKTYGIFATSVVDTGGAPSLANLRKFSKKFEMTPILFSGA
jgi:hypothetical protein